MSLILQSQADFVGCRRELRHAPDGLPLTVHVPLQEPRGTVLLIPGWSGPRTGPAEILVRLADELARAGWRAVRCDLPGRGDAPGEFSECGLDEMIQASACVARDQAGGGPLVLLGMCSGGNVALGAASGPVPECRQVIAISTLPFQPARSAQFERRRRWKNFKQYAVRALDPGTWLRLVRGEVNLDRVRKNMTAAEKPAAGRNLKDSRRDIERELLNWKGSTLFIWGGADEEGTLARAHFERLHGQGMSAPGGAVFHTVPGANHNFYGQAWRKELADLVVAGLSAHP